MNANNSGSDRTQTAAIGSLAGALAKAQAEMGDASKSAKNPHFGSSYADLASVWAACRGPLTKNGLSVIQTTGRAGEYLVVTTMLAHASGEWIASDLLMRPVKDDPQGVGSCLTYARRYGLAAMVGVASSDDDAEVAQARGSAQIAAATQQDTPRQQSERLAASPGGPTVLAPPIGPLCRFGQDKGKPLTQVPDSGLDWLSAVYAENLEDPKKARFRDANRAELAEVMAEKARRAQKVADDEIPF